jgi:hypothetical protein
MTLRKPPPRRTIDHDAFEDDGGTPQWREVHADTFKSRFKRASFVDLCLGVIALGLFVPFFIVVGGLIGLALWDALMVQLGLGSGAPRP